MSTNNNEDQQVILVESPSNTSLLVDNAQETQCGVLNWEQVRRLDTLLNETIPIHGRGNYPTLHVKLKDFIRNLNKRLVERQIRLKDIRINGGVASYVLAQDNLFEFSDIDIIFTCDLLNLNSEADSQTTTTSPESRFSNICDLIKETVFDCLIEYIPGTDCSASKEKLTWINIKEAYVKKMVKIYEQNQSITNSSSQNSAESFESSQSLSRWSLISLFNKQGQNIELKFVDKMKRQFQFSVDAFQIHLDSLLKYYDCQDSITLNSSVDASMTENLFPSVKAESLYGEFTEALVHLDQKLIATKRPEEIRGGGLLKYCNLLIRGFKPECETAKMNYMEKYMCSRFFIDFSDIKEQEHKLSSYLDSHFQNDSKMCIAYLNKLYHVVNASTVCLMGHERKQTLNLIEQLAKRFNSSNNQNLNSESSTHAEFYLDDENVSETKTFSSSSSEVDSTDSHVFYRQFKPNKNKTQNFHNQNYNNKNQRQNQNFNRRNFSNYNYNNNNQAHQQNRRTFYPNEYQNFYYNSSAYAGFYAANQMQYNYIGESVKVDTEEAENMLKQVNSSSSLTISSSISSTSTSPSPSPSPYQSYLMSIPIAGSQNDDKSLTSSGSVSSFTSSSSSSIVSSLVPSPSPSPPLLTYNQTMDENETNDRTTSDNKTQKIKNTTQPKAQVLNTTTTTTTNTNKSRILYCKLPASSNTSPYIEVFENCFCPPVVPILYDTVYINQHQQVPVTKQHYYSAPNIVTRIMPNNY